MAPAQLVTGFSWYEIISSVETAHPPGLEADNCLKPKIVEPLTTVTGTHIVILWPGTNGALPNWSPAVFKAVVIFVWPCAAVVVIIDDTGQDGLEHVVHDELKISTVVEAVPHDVGTDTV